MLGISCIDEEVLAPQEGACYMELFTRRSISFLRQQW